MLRVDVGEWAIGRQKVQTMSKVYPHTKFVHWLSIYKLCPEFVKNCAITTDEGIKFCSLSKVSPSPMFVQSITFCPLNIIHWTKSGQMLDCQVQSLSIQLINGQELYKLCISLDGEWTEPVLIILLDRHLTGLGQRLDSDWIWCPISVQPSKVQEYPDMIYRTGRKSYTPVGAAPGIVR